MALPTKEERIRRKKVMLAAGINVPNTDSSWGPWWEKLWNKAITHTKTNDYYGVPSTWNFLRRTFDNITGNTTYEAEPLPIGGTILATNESTGALIKRTLNNWQYYGDPVRDITTLLMPDPSKPVRVSKTLVKATPKLVKSVPRLFTKEGAKKAGKQAGKIILREAPKVGISIAVGKGVDKVSQKLTGKSWGENVAKELTRNLGFEVPTIIGDFTNPGNYGGYRYGNFITNNYSNLGRYTLDNLYPASYGLDKEHLVGLFNIATKPLYRKAPTFYNHRPKWFVNRYNKGSISDNVYLEARFENGTNWARIPELEVPRKHFIKNSDGTISPTHINTEPYNTALLPDKNDFPYIGSKIRVQDHLTPGKVGGEHSDYFYLGDDIVGNSGFEYIDVQKLNPQWKISDWIKKKYSLKDTSKTFKIIDKLGGIDFSPLLGYKRFTIKAGYAITPDGKFIQIDPDYVKKFVKTN